MGDNNTLRLAGIIRESIVDGPGIRFVVFCQGCPHDCLGCHNPESHDFNAGQEITIDKIITEIKKNPLLKGVTFSGGEPMCQAKAFAALARKVKDLGLNLTVFSGYTYEELLAKEDEDINELLSLTDLLIDGRYIDKLRDLTLKFRGSSNQRLIDMNKTREKGEIVLREDLM